MTEAEKLKLALDDVRARQKALTDLILFTDQQAMGLLRLYATLGAATASAGLAIFAAEPIIPREVAAGLLGVTAALFVGSVFCFIAMQTAQVALPGRGPDFWKWTLDPRIADAEIGNAYLSEALKWIDFNRALNGRTANALSRAKIAGMFVPVAALAAGIGYRMIGFWPF